MLPWFKELFGAVHGSSFPNPSCLDMQDTTTPCRICRDREPRGRLISPCLCKGSVKWVHDTCLQRWLKTKYPVLATIATSVTSDRLKRGQAVLVDLAEFDQTDCVVDRVSALGRGDYRCEVCQCPYQLLVAHTSWAQFSRQLLTQAFRRPFPALVASFCSHVRTHATSYAYYLGHLAYFVLLLTRILSAMRSLRQQKWVTLKLETRPSLYNLLRVMAITSVLTLLKQYVLFLWREIRSLYKELLTFKAGVATLTVLS